MFDIHDRMVYSREDTVSQARRFAEGMGSLLADPDFRSLYPQADRRQVEKELHNLVHQAGDKLNVVFSGSFKLGKSTLINSLLGQEVVPTDVLPETVTINHILWGEEPQTEAVLTNGMRLKLHDNEITREKLEQIQENVPAPIDHLEIRRNLPLLKELNFIDTPGLNDVQDFRDTVAGILARADIIVYVVSALAPMSQDEACFLNEVVMPQNFSKMFIVINKADTLTNWEIMERVKQLISSKVFAINPNASVYLLSALDNLCRITGSKRPNPDLAETLEQCWQQFLDALADDVILQKSFIKAERINTLKNRIVRFLLARLGSAAEMLIADSQDLDAAEQHLLEEKINMDTVLSGSRQAVTDFVGEKKREARVWMDSFLNRLAAELEQTKGAATGPQLQKHLQFYLSDKLKEAFSLCLDTHARELSEFLTQELKTRQEQIFHSQGIYSNVSVHLKDISWTKIDTAYYSTDLVLSELGLKPVSILLQPVFGILREHTINKSSQNMLDPLLDDFSGIREQVFRQVEEIYNGFLRETQDKITEFYRRSLEEALADIQNARAVKAEFEGRKAETLDIIARFRQQIQAVDAQWQE